MSDGAGVFLIVLFIAVYFLPSFVAAGKKNNGGVLIINLFLGWTVLGWVIALAWAASLSRNETPTPAAGPSGETARSAFPSDARRCPFCAEDIKLEAIVCKHCGRDLPRSSPAIAEEEHPPAAIP